MSSLRYEWRTSSRKNNFHQPLVKVIFTAGRVTSPLDFQSHAFDNPPSVSVSQILPTEISSSPMTASTDYHPDRNF